MRKLLLCALLSVTGGISVSGCVVRERREQVVARPIVARPGPCHGGVWVEGHRGRYGRWHPAHWRCPGVVERVEID